MSGRNPKGAALEQSHFESQEVVDCFEEIVQPLNQELSLQQRDVSYTARDLSLLVGQLQQFQQECLGAFNRPNSYPIRIPAKLLKVTPKTPLTKESPIYTILSAAYSYRLKHGWKKWDFSNPAKKQKNADLISSIRNVLIKRKFISIPKIAIMEPFDENQRKTVLSLIKKIGAIYVENKDEATHILHGRLHEYKDNAEEDWFRTLEKDGSMVLVHWWYYPDSFDSWLPQTEQFADPEEPPEHTGAWKILVRWLQDTERFNEYMNEEDYEDIDDDEEEEEEEEMEDESIPNTPRKRKMSNGDDPNLVGLNTSMSKQRSDSQQFDESSNFTATIHNPGHQPTIKIRNIDLEKPQTGSRQRKNEFEPYANADFTNISQYTAANVEYPGRPHKIQKIENNTDNSKVNIDSLIRATPYSYENMQLPEWYDASSIHDKEITALPELDNGLSIEEYKTCRNYMIETYKSNPDYYLTIAACKSKLDTDLLTLVRIHSFLEMNGLINIKPDPRRRIFDPYVDSDPTAQLKPKSQRNYKDIGEVNIQQLRDLIYNESSAAPLRSGWDLSIEDPTNPDGRKVFYCSNCKSDCSEIRYQSLKTKNFQVCIDCYLEGRFPAIYSSADFLRVENNDLDLAGDEKWSDEEILRLLEGIDKHDDDWLMISEHVGTRSKEQCVTQFLQLPINDEFLTAQLTKKELEELPFGESSNPVMTTIAFLSGHVNPGVGAAAAKSALKALLKASKDQVDTTKEDEAPPRNEEPKTEVIKDEPMNEAVNNDFNDAMDVDIKTEPNLENAVTEDTDIKENPNTGPFSKEIMKEATASALKSAVQVAHKLASYEDQEIQHWTRLAVKTMVDKLMIKLQQYEEIETSTDSELQELIKQQATLSEQIENLSAQHFTLKPVDDVNQ